MAETVSYVLTSFVWAIVWFLLGYLYCQIEKELAHLHNHFKGR